ncbi:MAG: M23 family metallopeptidase, partial [Kiritimatiellaeota bacterium]|nr:M23 family metallopeptidase [Kiritimatiellota bacterium]
MSAQNLYVDDSVFERSPWYAQGGVWGAVAVVAVTCVVLVATVRSCRGKGGAAKEEAPVATNGVEQTGQDVEAPVPKLPPSPIDGTRFPTGVDIANAPLSAFMATNPNEPRTAVWGSWRMGSDGRPKFHGGVDIAPLSKDRSGKPKDEVMAVAEGKAVYVNRVGDSSYGLHVILEHADPVGPVYTLYGHLASITPSLTVGDRVAAGSVLGIMGNTSTDKIAAAKAHLHFEIALMHT